MHPRNRFADRYDFESLESAVPELKQFIQIAKKCKTIDFSNPDAVRMLNTALLRATYNLKYWDLPKNYLCPPIPGRLNYLHYMLDLLYSDNDKLKYKGERIKMLDIGAGASLIFPLLAVLEFNWHVKAAELNEESFRNAEYILDRNAKLKSKIQLVRQKRVDGFFDNVIEAEDRFTFTVCNPPFYSSEEEAITAAQKKNRNIHRRSASSKRNYGGVSHELIYHGGEKAFIKGMIKQSRKYGNTVLWFSTMVSSQALIYSFKTILNRADVREYRIIDTSHGNRKSRILAWSFFSKEKRKQWLNGLQ